jgi:CHASE2 domain-containing sensor protein
VQATISDVQASQDDTKLTLEEKHMIWAFALTFFVAILVGVLLGLFTRNGAVAFLGFAITVAGGLILFGALQWISVIYIIILAILDVIAIVVAFKMLFFTEQ